MLKYENADILHSERESTYQEMNQFKSKIYNVLSRRSLEDTPTFKLIKQRSSKNQTVFLFNQKKVFPLRQRRNLKLIFRKSTKKLIILLSFLESLRQYSKEKLKMKAEFIKFKRIYLLPFYPDDIFVKIWQILIKFMLALACLFYPLFIVYDDFDLIVYIIDSVFLCDILKTFITSIVDENFNLKTQLSEICWKYLKTWLLLDIITILPYKFIYDPLVSVKLIKLVKYQFHKPVQNYKGQYVNQVILENLNKDRSYRLPAGFKLFFSAGLRALLLIHLFGCFYAYFMDCDYITSIYWSTQTITMIGYGDLQPNYLLGSIWIIVGLLYISLTIGDFAQLLKRSNLSINEEQKLIDKLAYQNELPEKLAQQINGFIKTNININPFWPIANLDMILNLPYSLQKYFVISTMLEIYKLIPFLQHDISISTQYLQHSRFAILDSNQIVYRAGQRSSEVYYLIYGDVRIVSKDKFTLLNIMEGTLFGEIEAIEEIPRVTYALVKQKSLLLVLRFQHLKKAMEQSKDLDFVIRQLYNRRRQLLQQNIKNEKIQKFKLKRQNVVIFSSTKYIDSPSRIRELRQQKQILDINTYNKQLLQKVIGMKRQKLEQFLIKFKRTVLKIIDLNRSLEVTPPEDWKDLNDFHIIKRIYSKKVLEEKNINYSKFGISSVYLSENKMLSQMMANYRNARQQEIMIKKKLVMHNKKNKERMDNITLKSVFTRFIEDPQFLNQQKIEIITSKYNYLSTDRVIKKQKNVILPNILELKEVEQNLVQIENLWTKGSILKFDLYKYLHHL